MNIWLIGRKYKHTQQTNSSTQNKQDNFLM